MTTAIAESNKTLAVATRLAWLWAMLMALIAFSVTFLIFTQGEGIGYGFILLAFTVAAFVCAYGLRRQRKPFHLVSLIIAVLSILFLLWQGVPIGIAGILINAVIIYAVVKNWGRFA